MVWWRGIFDIVVVEDEVEEGVDEVTGEEFNWAGIRWPSPIATNTVFISKIPRTNERSLGVDQVEEEEEPMMKKWTNFNY